MKNKYAFILTNHIVDPQIYVLKNKSTDYSYVGSFEDTIKLICNLVTEENDILVSFRGFCRVDIAKS